VDAANHRLTITIPRAPIILDADPLRLSQAISNLLNNAAKYTPPGGEIELSAREEEGGIVVSVRDNGVGIAPAMRPHLFKMFARGDLSIERAQGGLGIGLALVRSFVELHGGRVELLAHGEAPNSGSEFVIRLPGIVSAPPGRNSAKETLPRSGPVAE
jgi:signal transduction histidine kinase